MPSTFTPLPDALVLPPKTSTRVPSFDALKEMLVELSILRQVVRFSPLKVTLPLEVEVLPLKEKKPSGSVFPSAVKLCTSESLVMTVPAQEMLV